MATKLEMLKTNIANTQSLIALKLNAAQNKLLNVSTIFTFCSVYVSCGAAIAGYFGTSSPHSLNPPTTMLLSLSISVQSFARFARLGLHHEYFLPYQMLHPTLPNKYLYLTVAYVC